MAKFIKISFNQAKNEEYEVQWRKVIETKEELDEYHSMNARNTFETFLTLDRDESGEFIGETDDTKRLGQFLNSKVFSLKEGELINPMVEVANLCDDKYFAILNYIENYGAIQMNEAGGWSGIDGFLKTWNAKIIERKETSGGGFPIDDEIEKVDILILENSIEENSDNQIEKAKKYLNSSSIKTLYSLKDIDKDYLVKSILSANKIWLSSQLQSEQQINEFMELFSKLPEKNIYLNLDEDNVLKIKSHKLFETNNAIHKINFVNK